MNLPFTAEQFFSVFERYNIAVWPAQVILNLLGLGAIAFAARKIRPSDRIISLILSLLWLWTAVIYHYTFFSSINPAANIFALLCLLQGMLFLWFGVFRNRLVFTLPHGAYGVTGGLLLLYALVIYPLLGQALGHAYPRSPSFGLPCPTTIFTFGLLLWSARSLPKVILFIPFLWSLIGSSAALNLGVREDTGLLIAGIVGVSMLAFRKNVPSVHPADS